MSIYSQIQYNLVVNGIVHVHRIRLKTFVSLFFNRIRENPVERTDPFVFAQNHEVCRDNK